MFQRLKVYFFVESVYGGISIMNLRALRLSSTSVSICVCNKILLQKMLYDRANALLNSTWYQFKMLQLAQGGRTFLTISHVHIFGLVLTLLFGKVRETSVSSLVSFRTNCRQHSGFCWETFHPRINKVIDSSRGIKTPASRSSRLEFLLRFQTVGK